MTSDARGPNDGPGTVCDGNVGFDDDNGNQTIDAGEESDAIDC